MEKKVIYAIIIVLAVLIGIFSTTYYITKGTPLEFEWKGYEIECIGGSSGENLDTDFSDGTVAGYACHNGNSYQCRTRGILTHSDSISILTDHYGTASIGSSITCKINNIKPEAIKEIHIKSSSKIKIGGDGQCSSSLSIAGLGISLACPNFPYSEAKIMTDVWIKKSGDEWIVHDVLNQQKTPNLDLSWSSGVSGNSGGTQTESTILIQDITIECEEDYEWTNGGCTSNNKIPIGYIIGGSSILAISAIILFLRRKS